MSRMGGISRSHNPPGTCDFQRQRVWNGQPVTSQHEVAFTVFVVCAPTYLTCHLLRLSQLDNPLR